MQSVKSKTGTILTEQSDVNTFKSDQGTFTPVSAQGEFLGTQA